nr:hypothetical protein [Tanacetum cinerariifolium]
MKAKLALLEVSSSPRNPKALQPKNKGLVAEIFDWDEEGVFEDKEVTQVKVLMALADDELTFEKSHARNGEWVDITIRKDEEEVSEDEEVTQVKVLMALADDELTVGKSHAQNGEWVDITIRKVNTLLSIDEDTDWKNYLKISYSTTSPEKPSGSFSKLRDNAIDLSTPLSKRETMLRGYKYHPLHVITYPLDQIRIDLSYVEEPEAIIDRQDRIMRKKTIPFAKILWRNHPEREATWETEESIRTSYPHFLP